MSKTGKKARRKPNAHEDVILEITEDDYRHEVKSGVNEEHALKPGRHVFRRGGFKARHPNFDSKNAAIKVQVNIHLDRDIVEHFKRRAKSSDAAKYGTEINNGLRALVDSEKARRLKLRSVG
jgi:uncharacterized protein (DUF4415 family)